MPTRSNRLGLGAFILLLAGCGSGQPTGPAPAPRSGPAVAPSPAPGPDGGPPPGGGPVGVALGIGGTSPDGKSDPDKVRDADVSILFVGNSHTSMHDLPNLVCRMIQFRHPGKKVYSHVIGVSFLEDVARNPACKGELETREWKYVVLQAQKISVSGRADYSRKEGIEFAKLAKARGATVVFFSEWGLKNVADNGPRHEKIYTEMARAAEATVAPIGRAWERALSQRPEMALHDLDGNHQSSLGAFLTACVLFGRLTGESPAELAAFPYPGADEKDRKFLADAAAATLAPNTPEGK